MALGKLPSDIQKQDQRVQNNIKMPAMSDFFMTFLNLFPTFPNPKTCN